MEKHWFQKSTIVITLNRNKTHTTVQDSRAKTPIDLSVGTLYPSCQPSVKMPNRLSQPVKQTSMHCADLDGARVTRRRVVRNAIDSGPSIPVKHPGIAMQTPCTLTSGHTKVMSLVCQVNGLLGFGDNIITLTTQM